MAINNKTISSWIRQARHRAKKHDIYSDINVADVQDMLTADPTCAYCGNEAITIDCPFPIKSKAPNVPANIVLCCKECKNVKGTNDVVWLFTTGKLSEQAYLKLINTMLARRGGDKVKEYVKMATGIEDEK